MNQLWTCILPQEDLLTAWVLALKILITNHCNFRYLSFRVGYQHLLEAHQIHFEASCFNVCFFVFAEAWVLPYCRVHQTRCFQCLVFHLPPCLLDHFLSFLPQFAKLPIENSRFNGLHFKDLLKCLRALQTPFCSSSRAMRYVLEVYSEEP